MEFEITLTAKTTDEGGIVGGFNSQLAEFGEGATVTLLSQKTPYRVYSSDGSSWFQAERTYLIVL